MAMGERGSYPGTVDALTQCGARATSPPKLGLMGAVRNLEG